MKNKNIGDKLDFWSIVFLAINTTIGSGIFLTPASVVNQAGSMSLWVYLIAAICAAAFGISSASAAKYVIKSGASYAYSKAAFGDKLGFYMGILRYFAASVTWSVMATGVVKSTISIFGGNPNNNMSLTIGLLLLVVLITIINLFGQKVVKYVMNMATIGKLAALILIIIAAVALMLTTGATHHLAEVDQITQNGHKIVPTLTTSGLAMAVVSAFYSFMGFESVASGAEDMEHPEKNLPRAIPLSIFIIAFIYMGIIAVALKLAPQALMTTKQVVAISAIFKNEILRDLILIGALISMLGVNIAESFSIPRVLEAMAKEGQLSKKLTKRTANNFPIRSYFISIILVILIPMAFQFNMTNLITLTAMVSFVEFIVVPLSVMRFYRGTNKEQVLNAPKNVWTDIIIPIISILLVVFLLVEYNWKVQFGVIVNGQVVGINWYAIAMMVVGFLLLPLAMALLNKLENKQA
ncbi:APC family permease [Lactobacillus sp. ESL0731]|uniref:APC family permease n=1 Tax=unclassified Lactobacillus TaxID=2620435 RepID=UPI0023F6C055|nr:MULTISPECIES: APC family permease [unclassified Lactobacillus]WEV50550.1 APC family permease [Lactobacillus sp. ESL0700]WEV61680.1 APC family permease [Lactobacillus sp. ESL0731]